MNILPKFKVDIDQGKIIPEKEDAFNLFLRSLEEKKDYTKHLYGFELSIKPIRGIRTLEHNKFYWGVIVPIMASEMGSPSRMDAHEELVWQRYPNGVPMERKTMDGRLIKWTERKSTHNMSVKEFTDFVEWVKDFGSLHYGIDWSEIIEETTDEKGNKIYVKKYDYDNR